MRTVQTKKKTSRSYAFVSRVRDILLSALALVLLLPLLLLITAVVFLDDPHGSPLFCQNRCGLQGREFVLYKFRTMVVGAEDMLPDLLKDNEMDGPVFKIEWDPRITRVGRFLRRTGLDELPQLFNILRGDMSIVGPRPPLPREVAEYSTYQRQRLSVKPGLTCLWQISPDRNKLPFETWVELDLRYIRERSLLLDCEIILMTVWAVFRADGV